jgi:ABC-type multidrug transport system fused ATPase/permease subunit
MEPNELKQLWQTYDQKLDRSLAINMHCLEAIQAQKARSKVTGLLWVKILAVVAGLAWVGFLGSLLRVTLQAFTHQSLTIGNVSFLVSISMIILITLAGIALYIRHIIWIVQINASETIVDMQQKTASLQTSTLQVTRIMFLQMPFYVTWNLQSDWVTHPNLSFWLVYVPLVILFTWLAIWLYRNISYRNVDKKWFRLLFDSPEWTSPAKALAFLKEIEDFRNDK